MDIRITPDQEAFIRQGIEAGRFSKTEDAVQEALTLWEERERTRAEILAHVDTADASIARNEGRLIASPESGQELANEIKQRGRGRGRLAAG